MSRASTSVAVAAAGIAARLNLAASGVAIHAVQLGCDAVAAGKTFNLFGSLDSSAMATSPNIVPLVTGWTAPGSAALPVRVDGWPIIVAVQTTTGAAGTLYASAESSALPAAPTSTVLPAAGAFLGSPIACPGGKTRIMLDRLATSSDKVLVYTTENGAATSAVTCTFVATLTGGGAYVDVESNYIQVKTVAKSNAIRVLAAALTTSASAGSSSLVGDPSVTITADATISLNASDDITLATAASSARTAGAAISDTATTLHAVIAGTTVSRTGGTGVADTATTGNCLRTAKAGRIVDTARERIDVECMEGPVFVASDSNAAGLTAFTDATVRASTGTATLSSQAGSAENKISVSSTGLRCHTGSPAGFQPPTMTTTQRTSIAAPQAGDIVYDTSVGALYVYGVAGWKAIATV